MTSFRFQRLAWLALDVSIFSGVACAMNFSRGRELQLRELTAMMVFAGVAIGVARIPNLFGRPEGLTNWRFFALAWPLLFAAIWLVGGRLSQPLVFGEITWLVTASLGLGLIFHTARRAFAQDGNGALECLHLASLALAAGYFFRPFLTPLMLGGQDAHWYGHVMIDALQQARAGVFPVFVGQGEYMFNGAVHPFRTAPYHHSLGILLDVATMRVLTPLAVQHLTVIFTAVLAGLTSYLCLLALAPGRRWLAWGLTLVYISGPALAAYIYAQEMFMSFMAFGWLPLMLYGNIRIIRQDDTAGWVWLAVSLCLVWGCHAPVGIWASIFTVGVQGLRLLTRDFNIPALRRAAGGSLLLAGLGGYYFFSIAELAPAGASGSVPLLIYGMGFAMGAVALARLMATGRKRWLIVAGGALIALWSTERTYCAWIGAALALGSGFVLLGVWFPRLMWRKMLPECFVVVMILGGLTAAHFAPETDPARINRYMQAIDFTTQLFPKIILPVSPQAVALTDLQPGYAVLFLSCIGLMAVVFKATFELRLLSLALIFFIAMLIPIHGVTHFMYSVVPDPIYGVSSVSLWMRFLPTMVVVALFTGMLALARLSEHRQLLRVAVIVAVLDAFEWNCFETRKFIQRGYRAVNSSEKTTAFYRSENAELYSYAFNSLPHPGYLTNGVVDYHLESRLLSGRDHSLQPDPLLTSRTEDLTTWTTTPNKYDAHWLYMEPKPTVLPGEHLLLSFAFFQKEYAGVMIMEDDGFYRNYYLPESGFYTKSFGIGPVRPKTIALWNSSAQPREVKLTFLRSVLPAENKAFGDFARVGIRAYKPEELQIKTRSLIPYRAEVSVARSTYLETPRVFIPGYRARVNGVSTQVQKSPDHLVMLRLESGANQVEVFYRGTFAARMIFNFSAMCWSGVVLYGAWRLYRSVSGTQGSVSLNEAKSG